MNHIVTKVCNNILFPKFFIQEHTPLVHNLTSMLRLIVPPLHDMNHCPSSSDMFFADNSLALKRMPYILGFFVIFHFWFKLCLSYAKKPSDTKLPLAHNNKNLVRTVYVHYETVVVLLSSSFFPRALLPGVASLQDTTVMAEEKRNCNEELILKISVEACHFHPNFLAEQQSQPHRCPSLACTLLQQGEAAQGVALTMGKCNPTWQHRQVTCK